MKVMALDYGRVSTGAAVSDSSGTIVRPLGKIDAAASEDGINHIRALAEAEGAELVVVGMPVSLSGEHGAQALETSEFMELLSKSFTMPVISWDERFTSKLAAAKGRESNASEHSLAACCLLEDYLGSAEHFRRAGKDGVPGDSASGNGED